MKPRTWYPRLRVADMSAAERAVLLAAALFTLVALLVSLDDVSRYHAVDLRQKVLAARAILQGLDPYEYVWKPGMADTLLDPLRDHPGPTRTTNTPFTLLFYIPFCGLRYQLQRDIWWAIEWACGVGTALVWTKVLPSQRVKVGFLAMASFFVFGNWLWRLHVERGQYYVFIALLLSIASAQLLRKKDGLLTAFVIGVAVALRPTLGVFPVILFVAGRRKVAVLSVVAAGLLCAITVPIVGVSGWQSYFRVIQLHQSFDFDGFLATHYWPRFGPRYDVPSVAEGLDFRRDILVPNTTSVSFYELCGQNQDVRWLHFLLAKERFPLVSKAFAALITGASCLGALVSARRYKSSMRLPIALAIVGTVWVDFFVAPERFGYFDIILLLPIAALAPLLLRHKPLAPWFAIVILAFVFSSSFLGNVDIPGFRDTAFLATWLRFCLSMTAFAGVLVAVLARRTTPQRVGLPSVLPSQRSTG